MYQPPQSPSYSPNYDDNPRSRSDAWVGSMQNLPRLPNDLIEKVFDFMTLEMRKPRRGDQYATAGNSMCELVSAICKSEGFEYVCAREDFWDKLNVRFGYYEDQHLPRDSDPVLYDTNNYQVQVPAWTRFQWHRRPAQSPRVRYMEECLISSGYDLLVNHPMLTHVFSDVPSRPSEHFAYMCRLSFVRPESFLGNSQIPSLMAQMFYGRMVAHFRTDYTRSVIPGYETLAINLLRGRIPGRNISGVDDLSYRDFQPSVRKYSKKIAIEACSLDPSAYAQVLGELKMDADVAFHAILCDRRNFNRLSVRLKQDEDLFVRLVDVQPSIMGERFSGRITKELAERAVRRNWASFLFLDIEFRRMKDLFMIALGDPNASLTRLADAIKDSELSMDTDLCMQMVRRDPYVIWYLPYPKRRDRQIQTAAVQADGMILQQIAMYDREAANDPELCKAAIRQNWKSLQFVSPNLIQNPDFMGLVTRLAPEGASIKDAMLPLMQSARRIR